MHCRSLPKSKDEHTPFIPKRGEKDFEPIPFSSSLSQSSKEATLSQYQLNTLNESRSALFSALSSGSRFHSSRAYNSFTWRPKVEGGRASCDAGSSAYGVHFSNLGRHSAERKRLELLPEEALYMVERGAIELWREVEEGDEDAPKVPMTVQQAWAEIIGHDELTVERFQVPWVTAGGVCGVVANESFVWTGLRPPQAFRLRPYSRTSIPASSNESQARTPSTLASGPPCPPLLRPPPLCLPARLLPPETPPSPQVKRPSSPPHTASSKKRGYLSPSTLWSPLGNLWWVLALALRHPQLTSIDQTKCSAACKSFLQDMMLLSHDPPSRTPATSSNPWFPPSTRPPPPPASPTGSKIGRAHV